MIHSKRVEIFLFIAAFIAFAWFHQGGGWNQNSRFAEVRAMVEQGRFAIDDFLVYQHDESGRLTRSHVENGDYFSGPQHFRLMWNEDGTAPVNGIPLDKNVEPAALNFLACSGDVAFARGHFHPNKPPGTSFAALPAYFILSRIERALGCDPDNWWTISLNAWLTSALSVGFASAIAVVLFFRIAKIFADDEAAPALLATIAFAFGTLFFPFATLLFDHNLTAAALVASFYFLAGEKAHRRGSVCLSGFCAGFAAITNYIAAVAAALLGIYLLAKIRRSDARAMLVSAMPFALGAAVPLALICFYNNACYGSPFALATSFQNPRFKDDGGFLGMFSAQKIDIPLMLLFSQYRGLFFFCPSLLLAIFGFIFLRRKKVASAEAWLCFSMALLFFAVNATFNGWSAGYTSGPRYLIPAMPFLALLAVPAFVRFRKISCALAAIGVAINFLSTAVDAQCPVGTGFLATIEGRSDWENKPTLEYIAPLFFKNHAWPLLRAFLNENEKRQRASMQTQNFSPAEIASKLDALRREEISNIESGAMGPSDFYLPLLYLSTIRGPVSVNPIGPWEGIFYTHFEPHSPPCAWASFNAGEFIFPESRWSVAPMILLCSVAMRAAFCALKKSAPLARAAKIKSERAITSAL